MSKKPKSNFNPPTETFVEGDNLEAFEAVRLAFYQEYNPQDADEMLHVERIADCAWRNKRLYAMERDLIEAGAENLFTDLIKLAKYQESVGRKLMRSCKFLEARLASRGQTRQPIELPEDSPHKEHPWRAILEAE